jgi:hypothetical protein
MGSQSQSAGRGRIGTMTPQSGDQERAPVILIQDAADKANKRIGCLPQVEPHRSMALILCRISFDQESEWQVQQEPTEQPQLVLKRFLLRSPLLLHLLLNYLLLLLARLTPILLICLRPVELQINFNMNRIL